MIHGNISKMIAKYNMKDELSEKENSNVNSAQSNNYMCKSIR